MKDETPFRLGPGVELPSQRSVTNRATSFGHRVASQACINTVTTNQSMVFIVQIQIQDLTFLLPLRVKEM